MKSHAGRTLFSPMQIAVAAFIGGWLAGFIVLALNDLRLKRVRAAIVLVVLGAMLLAGWVELAASMPLVSRIPDVVHRMFVMLVTLLIATLAHRGQRNRLVARHNRLASAWHACAWLLPAVVASISMAAILKLVLI
jgi:hypothetical protein